MSTSPNREDLFVDLVLGYRKAKVVFTAHELGLFQALEGHPASPEEIAAKLRTDSTATKVLLGALEAIGLVEATGEKFANSAVASERLIPGLPGYVGHNLTYQELMWPGWSSLKEIVVEGRPAAQLTDLLASRPGFAPEYLKSVEHVSTAAAEEISALLPESATRILDIGGGLGTYARAFARRSPHVQVTVLDLPATLKVTEEMMAGRREREQVTLQACNYLTDEFGKGFDFALLSHVTHDESLEGNRLLFKKAFAALKPGGLLGVHDWVVEQNGTGSSFSTLFSVNLLVYTHGRVFSLAEYTALFEGCGFKGVSARPVLEGKARYPSVFITARKP